MSGRSPNDTKAKTVAMVIQGMIKESDIYRQNADNCMQLAEAAQDEAAYKRFKRMEAAWLALAEEQDWLDVERSPLDPVTKAKGK